MTIGATSSLKPIVPDPKITKIAFTAVSNGAVGGSAGGGDAAVTGSVLVDVCRITTQAFIGGGAQINQSTHGGGDQTISVTAQDDTHLVNVAGALALSEGDAGVAIGLIVDVISKDVVAYIGASANVYAGGNISVKPTSSMALVELAIDAGASQSAGLASSVIVVVLNQGGPHSTRAYIHRRALLHPPLRLHLHP